MPEKIRVLVVDDSALMRRLISDILERDPHLEVIDTARNGAEALEKVKTLQPDVVTMDIEMPRMDGLTALQYIMLENPVPVIMVSAMNRRQADITMKALDMGAVDFIPKTSGTLSLDMDKSSKILIEKVKIASEIVLPKIKGAISSSKKKRQTKKVQPGNKIVVIGASTGGPKALPEVISKLPRDIPAGILVVQHMPEGFTESFAERLNWYTSLEAHEAKVGDEIKPGTILVAPGNKHMEIKNGRIVLTDGERVNFVRPSVDVTMLSAVAEYGGRCIGVILTGMGSDGANGMKAIKEAGGSTIAQDEESSVVFGMAKVAIEMRSVDKVVPLDKIAGTIIKFMELK